jgi:hypothetical protein
MSQKESERIIPHNDQVEIRFQELFGHLPEIIQGEVINAAQESLSRLSRSGNNFYNVFLVFETRLEELEHIPPYDRDEKGIIFTDGIRRERTLIASAAWNAGGLRLLPKPSGQLPLF